MLIIDYDVGNIKNVQKLVESFGEDVLISAQTEEINLASSYILPGVGAFPDAMARLRELRLVDVIRHNVLVRKKPILGICLGMQLLGNDSEEGGYTEGLGLLEMSIRKISVTDEFRLPHIGWNDVKCEKESVLLNGLPNNPDFYFVHSFHAQCINRSIITGTCKYSHEIVATVEKNNIFGAQFHPEKSQSYGGQIIKNFINYCKISEND
uniref:imidazole glycerol phosphate synthase subunit HisH n=1 Tax=Polynucleobacter sp. TaxID=2029855 RepID=UPI004048D3D4